MVSILPFSFSFQKHALFIIIFIKMNSNDFHACYSKIKQFTGRNISFDWALLFFCIESFQFVTFEGASNGVYNLYNRSICFDWCRHRIALLRIVWTLKTIRRFRMWTTKASDTMEESTRCITFPMLMFYYQDHRTYMCTIIKKLKSKYPVSSFFKKYQIFSHVK